MGLPLKAIIRKKKKAKEKAEAREKIKEYFKKAEETPSQAWANTFIRKARNLAMKFKIRLSSEQKRKFCKHCYAYFKPPKNVRIRTKDGFLIYYCLNCKKYSKFRYKS